MEVVASPAQTSRGGTDGAVGVQARVGGELIKAEMPEAKIVMLTTSAEEHGQGRRVRLSPQEHGHRGTARVPRPGAARYSTLLSRPCRQAPSRICAPPRRAGRQPATSARKGVRSWPHSATARGLDAGCQGFASKEVGDRRHLSPRTVKYHMAEILERRHLDNRAQVLAYAGRMSPRPGGSNA
jgi:DNA-binding CsgD family transcriptional regulator